MADENLHALGSYSPKQDKITLYKFNTQQISNQKNYTSQYNNHNPLAQYIVALHEAIHNIQSSQCGMFQIGHTTNNTIRFDNLCEQLTCASEYLTIAQNIRN